METHSLFQSRTSFDGKRPLAFVRVYYRTFGGNFFRKSEQEAVLLFAERLDFAHEGLTLRLHMEANLFFIGADNSHIFQRNLHHQIAFELFSLNDVPMVLLFLSIRSVGVSRTLHSYFLLDYRHQLGRFRWYSFDWLAFRSLCS